MRICLYSCSAFPKVGGQEVALDALARQFLVLGHEPFVMAPRPRGLGRPRDSALPYPVIRHPRFLSTRRLLWWYRHYLGRAHRRHRFDLIHCHDVYPTGYLAVPLRKRSGVPLIITSQGGDVRSGNVRLVKPGVRPRFIEAVQSADALISIGPFTERGFLALDADPRRIVTIPNGVDLKVYERPVARPAGLDPAIVPGRYLLFIGRLHSRKGVDILLNALALLPADGPPLVVAGGGQERDAIERQVEHLSLRGRVHLVGPVRGELKTYLLQHALFAVVPSRGWEAFPLVVLESYAAGHAVVATDIPGLQDVVYHERTGLIVPPESPADLAAALRRALDDPVWLTRAGQEARRVAGDYDWPLIARRHIDVYTRVTQSPAPVP